MANNSGLHYLEGITRSQKRDTLAKISRREAQKRGQKLYWADEPCAEGHANWRYTSSHQCAECTLRRSQNNAARKLSDGNRMLDIDAKKEALALRRQLQEWEL